MMKPIALVLAMSMSTLFQGADGHALEEPCACHAKELNVTIDCEDKDAMVTALADVQTLGCDQACESEACKKAFAVVQIHHDYCFDDEVPPILESEFHKYEDSCACCQIYRKRDPSKPDCPKPTCTTGAEGAGKVAYQDLIAQGCALDCSSDNCVASYRMLRAEHDTCDEEVLDQSAEEGIHAFEDICKEHTCNVLHEDDPDPLICLEEEEDETSAGSTTSTGILTGALFLLAALVVV